MTQATAEQVAGYAQPLVERIIAELDAKPDDNFAHMGEIKNLAGDVTGFARVYTADRVRRLSHLSIDIMPGVRYFNVMACTADDIDAPRFMHEGMISVHGSHRHVSQRRHGNACKRRTRQNRWRDGNF